jgi:four helix bundle protein
MADAFRDLIAWQKAMAFVTDVYRATESFPQREIYGLTNQVRRAAVSVASNIAEGKDRLSKKEFVQFLSQARGSLLEAQTQLEIARNLRFLRDDVFADLERQAQEVGRIINGLITKIRRPAPESRELRAES